VGVCNRLLLEREDGHLGTTLAEWAEKVSGMVIDHAHSAHAGVTDKNSPCTLESKGSGIIPHPCTVFLPIHGEGIIGINAACEQRGIRSHVVFRLFTRIGKTGNPPCLAAAAEQPLHTVFAQMHDTADM
jgi:hypothetical protein